MNTDHKKYLSLSVLATVLIVGVVIILRVPIGEGKRGYALAKEIGKDIAQVLQFTPVITVNQEVVFDRSVPIAELALAEKSFSHTYTWEQSWMGSKKRLSLQGMFKAKGGYDLSKPFVINVSQDGKSVSATVPEVDILSVELVRKSMLADEDGWWNKITKEEREQATNAMLREARIKAINSSLRVEVEAELERRLRGLLKDDEVSLAILGSTNALR